MIGKKNSLETIQSELKALIVAYEITSKGLSSESDLSVQMLAQRFKTLKQLLQSLSQLQMAVGRDKALTGRTLGSARQAEAKSGNKQRVTSETRLQAEIDELKAMVIKMTKS